MCNFLNQPLLLPYMKPLLPPHPHPSNFYPVFLLMLLSSVPLHPSPPCFLTQEADLNGLIQLLVEGAPSKEEEHKVRIFKLLVAPLLDRLKLAVSLSETPAPLKVTFSAKLFCVPLSGFC